jgi:flagellar M-ring protein FliF
MAELLQKIRSQINDFYKSLDKRKKIGLALGGLFLVVVIIAVLLLTRPRYVPLASNLEFDEMALIVNKLDEMGLNHKDDGYNTVLVDVKDLTKAKMALSLDLQFNQPDYTWMEVFADTSFTTSSEVREHQVMQARTSALKMAIQENIEGVESANVTLDIAPESSFLLEAEKESRVSVILVLEDGFSFSKNQISGIVNLIHNGIPNLPKENISLIDQTGQTLNGFSEDSEAFLASNNFEQTIAVENQLQDKILKFLASIYGMPHIKVTSAVKLNFDGYESQRTVFSPPVEGEIDGMVRSLTEISEKVVNTDGASGVPGTDTNTGVTDYPQGADGASTLESASRTINYEMNEIVEVLEKAKGSIEDITISILIDTKALEDNVLTEEHKQEVINLVTSAAGIETRNVTVVAATFAEDIMGFRYSSEDVQMGPGIPLTLVFGILAVVLVGVVVFFILSKRKANKEKEAEIAAIQAEEAAKRKEELKEIQTDVEDKSSPKYQIEKFIDSKPEAVAALLRSWMSDM